MVASRLFKGFAACWLAFEKFSTDEKTRENADKTPQICEFQLIDINIVYV
jgi:hypothetical protein